MHEDEQTRTEAHELRETSEAHHAKVVELSDKAQETHESIIKYFKRIDEIRVKADEAHNKFMETREKASEKHEFVKGIFNEIKKVNKALDKTKSKKEHRT